MNECGRREAGNPCLRGGDQREYVRNAGSERPASPTVVPVTSPENERYSGTRDTSRRHCLRPRVLPAPVLHIEERQVWWRCRAGVRARGAVVERERKRAQVVRVTHRAFAKTENAESVHAFCPTVQRVMREPDPPNAANRTRGKRESFNPSRRITEQWYAL